MLFACMWSVCSATDILLASNHFLSSPMYQIKRKHLSTHQGVGIKLPLGAWLTFTNGPPPADNTGIDEFGLLR